jgi:outer membrane protein, heavy metal efflux system
LQRAKLLASRQIALYYANTIVPQSQRLLDAAERQYNVTQIGVFQLLQAKEKQIRANLDYVTALTTYWKERVRLAEILNGKLPEESNGYGGTVEEPRRQTISAGYKP